MGGSIGHRDSLRSEVRIRARVARCVSSPSVASSSSERLRDSVPERAGPFPVGGWVLPPLSRDVGARTVLDA
ncbi:hypothetical protein YT1_3017 [Rhodococcus ruber]|nr:hypothetical protein YT1_3017 [Rhodococcus ruber]